MTIKLQTLLFLTLSSIILNRPAQADPNKQAIIELGKEIQTLENKKETSSSGVLVKESNQIFNNLENRIEGEEEKTMVSVANNVTGNFLKKLQDYNNFLNIVSEPEFFDMKIVQDPKILDKQILTANEYVLRSKDIAEESKSLPDKMRSALQKENIDSKKIQQVLNGMAQSEAQSEKTPAKIMSFRVKHAELMLKALKQLKAWKGKWSYSETRNTIIFNTAEQLEVWNNQIIAPLQNVEKKLT